MQPWLRMPHTYWRKAVLAEDPKTILGHAGWLCPDWAPFINVWQRHAASVLGFREIMGWSEEEEAEIWAAVNVDSWNEELFKNDRVRKEIMGEEQHW
jgi:hypothetical protein